MSTQWEYMKAFLKIFGQSWAQIGNMSGKLTSNYLSKSLHFNTKKINCIWVRMWSPITKTILEFLSLILVFCNSIFNFFMLWNSTKVENIVTSTSTNNETIITSNSGYEIDLTLYQNSSFTKREKLKQNRLKWEKCI